MSKHTEVSNGERAALPAPDRAAIGQASAALSAHATAAYVSLDRASLYRLMRTGDFPRPLRLSPGRVAWLKAELDQWLAQRGRA